MEIWQVNHIDLLLVASGHPLGHDAALLRARIGEEPFATALRGAWRAEALEDVLGRFVAGPGLARSLGTDDRDPVEFAFARSLSRSGLFEVGRLRREAAAIGAGRPALTGDIDWVRVERQRSAIYTISGSNPPADPDASATVRARAEAHAQYLAGDLAAAARTLLAQPGAPEGAVETTLVAEGLAEVGDPGAVPHIQAPRRVNATEAEAATARLAFRMDRHDLARDALVAAFAHYRTDPWPGQVSMSHALALADELTLKHPDAVPVLFEALGQPFAAAALEEPRPLVLLSVGSHGGLSERCRQAVIPYEPHVPWRADVLRYRANCYAWTADARAAEARVDIRAVPAEGSRGPGGDPAPGAGGRGAKPGRTQWTLASGLRSPGECV